MSGSLKPQNLSFYMSNAIGGRMKKRGYQSIFALTPQTEGRAVDSTSSSYISYWKKHIRGEDVSSLRIQLWSMSVGNQSSLILLLQNCLFNLSLSGRPRVPSLVGKYLLHLRRIIHMVYFSLSVAFLIS